MPPFHSSVSYLSVKNELSSIVITYSKSVLVLSCVSAIVQIRIIDKVYLISWLSKVLWIFYFLMKLPFEKATFSEPLFFKDRYFFQEVILFS